MGEVPPGKLLGENPTIEDIYTVIEGEWVVDEDTLIPVWTEYAGIYYIDKGPSLYAGDPHNSTFRYYRTFGIATGISNSLVSTPKRWSNEYMTAFLANMSQQLINIDPASFVTTKTTAK